MTGWIKFEKSLETDPRVLRMAKTFAQTCNAGALHPVTQVCGGLLRMWIYVDSHGREDDTLDMTPAELEEAIGFPGFTALLPADWFVVVDDNTIKFPGFQEHNGVEAKKRALTAKRVERHRARAKHGGDESSNASALPDQTRPD